MHRIQSITPAMLVSIADAVTSLDLPPPDFGLVPASWTSNEGCMPEMELEIWAADAVSLTDVELFAGHMNALSFADITVTPSSEVQASLDLATKTTHCDTVIEAADPTGLGGDQITIAFTPGAALGPGVLDESAFPTIVYHYKTAVTTVADFEAAIAASINLDVKTPGTPANVLANPADTFTATPLASGADASFHAVAHGLLTGDGPVLVKSDMTIPAPMPALVWVIKTDDDHFEAAASLTDAMSGIPIEFTSAGSGTVKVASTADTARVHWASHGLLGPLGDGAIDLTDQRSYWTTRPHSPRAMAYALKATFGSAVEVSAAFYGRMER